MNRKILLVLLMLAFAGYAGWNFVDSVTPYVGVAAAQKELMDGVANYAKAKN